MKRFLSLFLLLLTSFVAMTQVTTDPAIVTEVGAVKIIFDASKGNGGLKGYAGPVYAHTGVITDKSTSGSDWKYAPSWGDNQEKYKLASLGGDRWQLTLSPNIRAYYGVPADEKILKLAFVFRSGDKQKEGKGEGNTDIFVTLNEQAFVPAVPERKPRPEGITDGITYREDGSVVLSLYAPGKRHVHLLGDFNRWTKSNDWQMYRDGDHWWRTVGGLKKGEEYAFQYLIDNAFKVADAYAEKILDPWNDRAIPVTVYPDLKPYPMQTEGIVSVMRTGAEPYRWQTTCFDPTAADRLVVYELLVRDFTKEGTITAAIGKLDYLKAMGVNAVELMPVQEFDGNDSWGYNPSFYFAPDKAYGTPNDYKRFIDEAHARGMSVILDVVFNHATLSHPFARLYWDGETGKPAADNPWFNVDAPHPYNVFSDFNHEYSGTREFFKRVLKHWLTVYRVDGFRFDLTKGFTQTKSTEATASRYDASRIAILKDYHAHIRKINPKAYTILEHFCENKEEKELADDGMLLWNNMNHAYCQSAMGYKDGSSLKGGSATSRSWKEHRLMTYQESHDEERTMYKAKTWGIPPVKSDEATRLRRAALNAAFLLCTPGPKMIWQFGELGYDYSIEENGRTGRKPVRWDYYEEMHRHDLFDTYTRLLALRRKYPGLFASPASETMNTDASDWENGRRIALQHAEADLLLLGNFTDKPLSVPAQFPTTGRWKDIFSDAAAFLEIGATDKNREVLLQPHGFHLYLREPGLSPNEKIEAVAPCEICLHEGAIAVRSAEKISRISLYSFGGCLLRAADRAGRLDVADISSGIYLVTVRTASGEVYSQKIVIDR